MLVNIIINWGGEGAGTVLQTPQGESMTLKTFSSQYDVIIIGLLWKVYTDLKFLT